VGCGGGSDGWFTRLLAATGIGFVILDEKGRIIEANREYAQLAGRTDLCQVKGRSVVEWAPPRDQQRLERAMGDCLESGSIRNLEVDYLMADGRLQPVEINAMVMAVPEGKRIVSLWRNLTERRRAELRMALLNHLKERLLLPEPLDGKLKMITQAVVDIFGSDFARIWIVRPGDLCKAGCFHAEAREDRHTCRDHERCLHLVASSGRYTHLDGEQHRRVPFGAYKIGRVAAGDEAKFITNDAAHDARVHDHEWARRLGLVAFAGYRLLSSAGKPIGVLALFSRHEITADEDALLQNVANTTAQVLQTAMMEEALRAKTEELDRYFTGSLDLLCIADTGGHFRRLNPEWARTLGYSLEELTGKAFLDFVHPDDMASTRAAIADLAAQRDVLNFVNRFRCRDGSYRWIEWRALPSGHHIYAVARDITERQRVQQERIELERRVQQAQKLESLGVLAGGIAHDFNNLLCGILGSSELALVRLEPGHPARSDLALLRETAQRATELCRQMLAYSGKGRFVVEALDLSTLVAQMRKLLEVSLSKKAVLGLNLAQPLPAVDGDATQLRQILLNLVINASEAIGEREGTVTVTTGAQVCCGEELRSIYLHDELPAGTYVFVEVGDTGCGMDEETRRRIFDPFFSTKFSGRGLGLAATLGIVRGHCGTIRVQSEPGVGTTVKVLLPASRNMATEKGESVEIDKRLGGGVILLVDDDEAVRVVGERMLEHLGFRVLLAEDGVQGVAMFREHADEISAVVLDMTMPRLSGEEAFREMRRIRPGARIVLTSGYNEQDATNRFAGRGLAGFLQKPFEIAGLREKLRAAIEGDSSQ